MNVSTAPEQMALDKANDAPAEVPHMIARVTAIAVRMVYPFVAKKDIRLHLNGINIRPLNDGSVMVIATDGYRYIVVRDPNGYAEKEVVVLVTKDALKHAGSIKHTLDVMSNGQAQISDEAASALFIQPGNSIIDATYPRLERVASTIGYHEGIKGAVNPRYLHDALSIGRQFGDAIRFFTRDDDDSPVNFVIAGIGELECFGGIMKLRESLFGLPEWFPKPGEPTSLDEV